MKRLTLSACFLLFGTAAWANKLIVEKVKNNNGEADPTGIVYALPKTVVVADVTFKRIEEKAGKYAQYAADFFDLTGKQYPVANKLSFSVASAAIQTRQVADASEVYRVLLTKEWLKDRSIALEFAEDGSMTSGEVSVTNRRVDFFLSILGAAASIGGKFLGSKLFAAMTVETEDPCSELITATAYDPQDALTAPIEARRAYCNIAILSERRRLLLLGEAAPPDGTAAILAALDEQVRKLSSENFTGVKTEDAWTARFEDLTARGDEVELATYRDGCGLTALGAGAVEVRIPENMRCVKLEGNERAVRMRYEPAKSFSLSSLFKAVAPSEHSFAFRYPALKEIVVTEATEKRTVGKATTGVAQLGAIGYMPAEIGGKKSTVKVTLHPNGALKSVNIGVEAQGSIAETAGAAAGGLVDAGLARQAAAKAETDELAQAERRQKLLEAQVAAMRAQCILEGRCELNPK